MKESSARNISEQKDGSKFDILKILKRIVVFAPIAVLAYAGIESGDRSDNINHKPAISLPDDASAHIEKGAGTTEDGLDRLIKSIAVAPIWAFDKNARIPHSKADAQTILSQSEIQCMKDALYHEARGISPHNKTERDKAWARVILTIIERALSARFPNSMCGVVWQRKQFSFTPNARLLSAPKEEHIQESINMFVDRLFATQTLGDLEELLMFYTGLNGKPLFYKATEKPISKRAKNFFNTLTPVGQDPKRGHTFYSLPKNQ